MVGLIFSITPSADAMQNITITKISLNKDWSKMNVVSKITDFPVTDLSDLTISLAVVNTVNDDYGLVTHLNAKSLTFDQSTNMEITKVTLDAKGVMKIESKLTGMTKTHPSDLVVAILLVNPNGESVSTYLNAK